MRPAPWPYSRKVSLNEELERIAAAATLNADAGETLAGILAAEPHPGERVYLCAFEGGEGRSWLALDGAGARSRAARAVRDAASIAALCELAEEVAAGGDLDDLISRLVAVRMTEAPAGIEEAEEAARNLQRTIEPPPRLASPDYLDRIGDADPATRARAGRRRLAVRRGNEVRMEAVDQLTQEIEANYKGELS